MPRPVKVAIAMPGGFEFGGIGRIMMYATQAWRDRAGAPDWWLVDARGPASLLWMPFHLVRAVLGLAVRRPDILHLNVAGRGSTWRKLLLGEAASLLGIATLVHLHDFDYAADLARRSPAVRRWVARLFGRAQRVVVLGERDRDTVVDRLGVPRARVTVLHNAVPDPGPPPERSGRPGPVRLLFLGHLDDRKGVPELLAALDRPELRARDWRLVLAGGGELARFRRAVEGLGLGERVEVPGWLSHDEVYELCRDADVFVLPSHGEGQAMSLLEAMAHGLAIVTTPVGAHLEAVADREQALLIEPGDVAELSVELVRLLDEPELRLRLGASARSRYLSAFTMVRYAENLAAIYRLLKVEERE